MSAVASDDATSELEMGRDKIDIILNPCCNTYIQTSIFIPNMRCIFSANVFSFTIQNQQEPISKNFLS